MEEIVKMQTLTFAFIQLLKEHNKGGIILERIANALTHEEAVEKAKELAATMINPL